MRFVGFCLWDFGCLETEQSRKREDQMWWFDSVSRKVGLGGGQVFRGSSTMDVLTDDVDHHALIGSDDNLSAFLRFEQKFAALEEKRLCSKARVEALQFECMADDIPIEECMMEWSDEEVRSFFESGGLERPDRTDPVEPVVAVDASPVTAADTPVEPLAQYQIDMFGVKRGRCLRAPECGRFRPRSGLYKTEGLGGLALTACALCGHQNLEHEDLGRWVEGEPQLVDEDGKRWKWIMGFEEGAAMPRQMKVLME
jgi:hypothetical protein